MDNPAASLEAGAASAPVVADSHNPAADSLAATLQAVSCPEEDNRIPAADNLEANRQARAQSHWLWVGLLALDHWERG